MIPNECTAEWNAFSKGEMLWLSLNKIPLCFECYSSATTVVVAAHRHPEMGLCPSCNLRCLNSMAASAI